MTVKWETMVKGQVWHHYPAGEPFRFLVVVRKGEAFQWSVRGGEKAKDGSYGALASGSADSLPAAKRSALESAS